MTNTFKIPRLVARTLVLAALGGCAALAGGAVNPATTSPAAPPSTRPAAEVRVSVDNFSFSPAVVTVPVGGRVTWTNRDDVPHTVTANTRAFTSPALDTDEKYPHVFSAPGEYAYFCGIHPHMTGRVIVK
jgi:plastocyanin